MKLFIKVWIVLYCGAYRVLPIPKLMVIYCDLVNIVLLVFVYVLYIVSPVHKVQGCGPQLPMASIVVDLFYFSSNGDPISSIIMVACSFHEISPMLEKSSSIVGIDQWIYIVLVMRMVNASIEYVKTKVYTS